MMVRHLFFILLFSRPIAMLSISFKTSQSGFIHSPTKVYTTYLTQCFNLTAPPGIKSSNMKDGHAYESLPLVYSVEVSGTPKPTIRWLHDGKEVKQCGRVHITNDGDLFKLEIDSVSMKDAGKWQCEIINDLGKQVQTAELSVSREYFHVFFLKKPPAYGRSYFCNKSVSIWSG